MHWTGVLFGLSLILYGAYLASTFKRGSRALLAASTAAVAVSWASYAYAFLAQDFSLLEVARNTNVGMEWWLRLAASWAGTGSSLLLLVFFIGVFLYLADRAGAPVNAMRIGVAVLLALGASAYFYDTFATLGEPTIGGGINPLLKSFWISIHPPLVFLGYAGVFVASLALALGESQGVRRLLYAALGLLFAGLVVGGYWSYVTFGWGGYWAWDPVETAQLMVFVTAAAALHAPASLHGLRRAAFLLSASGVFLALFVTRTGMSPLHGFASPGAGGYLLLAVALLFFFAFLREVLTAKLTGGASWGRLITFLTIFVAGVFLYGSLLLPSLGVAAGVNTSPPQMDDGMWFYNPALYVLVLVTLVLSPLIYLERGGRSLLIYIAAGAVASAIAAGAVVLGVWTPSPKSHFLTNVAVAVALAWSVLAAGVVLYSAVGMSSKTLLRLLHFSLLLFFVAAVYSLPHAYNKAYFTDVYIQPGASVKLKGVEIAVENYSLGLLPDKVDVYTVYRDNAVYYYAQYGLLATTNLLAQVRPMLDEAASRVARSPVLKALFDAVQSPLPAGDVYCKSADGRELKLRNASLGAYAAHVGGSVALLIFVEGASDIVANQTGVRLASPCVVRAGPLTVNMSGTVVVQGGGGYASIVPMSAVASAGGQNMSIPAALDMNLTFYYMALTPGFPIYGVLKLPYYALLSNVGLGHFFSQKFPAVVPSGAYSKAVLSIDGRRAEAVVRYEVSGEVSGVHGLVSTVVTVPKGLGDVYIAVFTPYVQGQLAYYPEPMVYYVHHILKSMPPEDALRIAAVLTAGFFLDQLKRAGADTFATTYTNALLEVLGLAYGYSQPSPAFSEGIHISIKEVPGVNLLWASAVLAVALLAALAARR